MRGYGLGRGYRRTAICAGASVAALVASLAGAGPSAGQESDAIDPGQATARAGVITVAPVAGALAFNISAGGAIAETAGGLGQALAQAADLGLIGTALTGEGCDGGEPIIAASDLPSPLKVDNRDGPASFDETEAPIGFPGLGIGRKQVSATMTPSSRASVTFADVEVPSLLQLAGGHATTEAEVFPEAGREARATVTISVSIAGVVNLTGLRWHAAHRTGGEDRVEAGFTIDALDILGIPIPTDDLVAAIEPVNAALATLGLRLDLPTVERLTDPVDIVRVSPLRLVVVDTPLGVAVRPVLELTRDLRSQIYDQLTEAYCSAASLLLIGEIGVGVASGTGSLIAEVGGVEATSADIDFEDLLNQAGTPPPGQELLPSAPVAPPAVGPVPALPSLPGRAPVVVDGAPVAQTTQVCRSVHPFGWPSCSRGAAGLVGAIGVAGTAGIAVLDLRRRRALGTGTVEA